MIRQRLTLLALLLFCGSVFTLQAQEASPAAETAEAAADLPSVDEVLSAFFENTGGEENWASLKTTTAKATMAMGPMEFSGTVKSALPNKQRIDIDVQGQQLVQAYDGETAWQINPFAGGTKPQPMSAEEAEQFTKQEFQSPFLNWKEKGHQVEVTGTKEVDGTETVEVTLTKKNGDVEKHYFDTEYMVPIMQTSEVTSGPMKGQVAETFLSDYQEVDGFMMPFFIETKMNGQSMQKITLSDVKANVEIDETIFAMPKE